jgi:acetyl esterase/lipase
MQVEFPYYGPRRPADQKGFQTGLLQANFADGIAATRQAVGDVRRAADWLLSRPEIDPERLGIVGISLGGIAGSLCAGVDPRLKRNVFVIAGGDVPSILMNESRETRQVREKMKERGIGREELEKQVLCIEPARFAGRIDPKGTLMLNAQNDEVIPKVATEKLWHAAHEPEIVWYPCGHRTIAAFIMDVLAKTREHFLKPPAEATAGAKPRSEVF